jgi:hypothetical protein
VHIVSQSICVKGASSLFKNYIIFTSINNYNIRLNIAKKGFMSKEKDYRKVLPSFGQDFKRKTYLHLSVFSCSSFIAVKVVVVAGSS